MCVAAPIADLIYTGYHIHFLTMNRCSERIILIIEATQVTTYQFVQKSTKSKVDFLFNVHILKKRKPMKESYSAENPMVEYWTSDEKSPVLPEGQENNKRRWYSIIMLNDGFKIVEYEIRPRSRVTMSQMLSIIADETRQLANNDTQSCGFKVW